MWGSGGGGGERSGRRGWGEEWEKGVGRGVGGGGGERSRRRGWGEEWEEGVGRGVGGGVGERSGSSSGVTWLNCRSVMPFPPPSCVCVIHSYFSFYHIQKTLSGEGEGGRYLPEGSIREPAPDGKL